MSRPRRAAALVLGALLAVVVVLSSAPAASAHPINTSAVRLDLGATSVTATVDLPLDQLSIARGRELTAASVLEETTLAGLRAYVAEHLSITDATGRGWTTTVTGGRVEQLDGVDDLVLDATMLPADGGPVGDVEVHDDAILDQVVSHRIFVTARYGHSGDYTTVAMLSWQRTSVPLAAATGTAPAPVAAGGAGFVSAVRLGFEHIRSGSDHLLFLVMLLLPAPLLASGRRWVRRPDLGRASRRVVHVVTAFAVGHSITLALGSLGWVHLPTRLVEGGIALSVLVSAVHALRPLVGRGEVIIAGSFGLLHGLSFAALLDQLDLSRSSLVTTLLGFNLGIELTQLLVVALVMPSLMVISRTTVYPALRTAVAATGVVLAAGWLAERTGVLATNPLEPVGELVVDHPAPLVVALAVTALLSELARRSGRLVPTARAPDRRDPAELVTVS